MSRKTILDNISSDKIETTNKIQVSLSTQLISLLSEQLYQSPLKAIEELVVNSYDAGAKICKVYVPAEIKDVNVDKILVYDNGIGMDVSGLTTLWAIGGSNKRESGDKIDGRKIIGKFGIGKLATYAIANVISYVSRKDDKIYSVKLDYQDFRNDASGGREPVSLPVNVINDIDQIKNENLFSGLLADLHLTENDLFSAANNSWTIVILESLKEKVNNLKLGRLRWVLSSSMPINPSFDLFLNNEQVESSKLDYKLVAEFRVNELNKMRINSLNEQTKVQWQIDGEKLVSATFPSGISGTIKITERSLLGGKSSDVARSHGFFIKVRGRIINQEDETFGIIPSKMGTFNRMYAIIEADDLDTILTASRESIENSESKKLFLDVLNEVFNEATSKYNAYLKGLEQPEQRKKEGERNFVNHELMEFSLADTLTFSKEIILKGGEPDNSFFYLDLGNIEDKDQLIKDLYSERKEKYKYEYNKGDRAGRLVKYIAKDKVFWINENHDFIKANIDGNKSMIEDFVTAETMLEVYLLESGISKSLIGEILEKRDRLLRGLASDHPISLKYFADALRESSDNELDLEINHVIAMRALGFTAKHIAGPGKPDGLATFNTYDDGIKTITLESKSSKDTPGLPQLDFAGLHEHMKDHKAIGCMLLSPSYPGGSREDASAAAKRAKELKISCWTIEQLAVVLEQCEDRKINSRDIMRIVETCFTPDEVSNAIGSLLNKIQWTYSELYEAIIRTLEALKGKLTGSSRTIDMVSTAIALQFSEMSTISKSQVEDAVRDMSHISKGALLYREHNIVINTSLEELRQRLISHTKSNESSRKDGNFK